MPRAVSAIFYAAPGVAGGQVAGTPNQAGPGASNPSIGGSTGLENLYVVDGVTITDQAYGSLGTYNVNHGSLGTGINLAFIKEVDVKSYGFEPQYGKAQGGIVQMVTKSGSNAYHGAIGAYLGPGSWYARRKQFYQLRLHSNHAKRDARALTTIWRSSLADTFPHFRDKIFFFGAFNPSLDQNINIANPSFTSRGHRSRCSGHPRSVRLQHNGIELGWKTDLPIEPEDSSLKPPASAIRRATTQIPNTLSTANIQSSLSSYHYGITRFALPHQCDNHSDLDGGCVVLPTTTTTSLRPRL